MLLYISNLGFALNIPFKNLGIISSSSELTVRIIDRANLNVFNIQFDDPATNARVRNLIICLNS